MMHLYEILADSEKFWVIAFNPIDASVLLAESCGLDMFEEVGRVEITELTEAYGRTLFIEQETVSLWDAFLTDPSRSVIASTLE